MHPESSRDTDPPGRAPACALVLQGGGALGAYQAGVFEGLSEAGIAPDWVAGISIGAINAALIAGNPPARRVERLREFWETVCRPAVPLPALDAWQDLMLQAAPSLRRWFNAGAATRAVAEGQSAFFTPRGPWPWLGLAQAPEEASFYDTTALRRTLERLVDFDLVNDGPVRLSVGAVNVRSGNLRWFDNGPRAARGPRRLPPPGATVDGHRRTADEAIGHTRIGAAHIMASGALPPAFAAVEIDGEHYWDGGIVSNTPLDHVLQETLRHDLVAFQVDLWSARGPLPRHVYDAQERLKDIQYSSRTRAATDGRAGDRQLRHLLHALLQQLPASLQDSPLAHAARAEACAQRVSVIHLIYQDKAWEGYSKDYEFSPRTMRDHWQAGLDDIRDTLRHQDWHTLGRDAPAFATHDRLRTRG